MAYEFTKDGAVDLHEKFDKLCEQFAKENNIVFSRSRLTYGDKLKFSIEFGIEDNINEEWNSWVKHFKDVYNIDLRKGMKFTVGRTEYTINGEIKPGKSRFKIGVTASNGKTAFFDPEGLAEELQNTPTY